MSEAMDLSLASSSSSNNNSNNVVGVGPSGSSSPPPSNLYMEKEHLFDKVVTPSDVGKLNRLVIPKQHAEKHFPLDSSSDEKGLLLSFEDRNGKPWRFRYSYWNSSQSYVMTKGWSRFVKDKKLDAGDIVSFHRGIGESGRHKLYIDWRRRTVSVAAHPVGVGFNFAHFDFRNQMNFQQPSSSVFSSSSLIGWGTRLYPLPLPQSSSSPRSQYDSIITPQFQQFNRQLHHPQLQQQNSGNNAYYMMLPPQRTGVPQHPTEGMHQNVGAVGGNGHHDGPMVIDSAPVLHGNSVGKRIRLFGVNMECSTAASLDHEPSPSQSPSASTSPSSSSSLGMAMPAAQHCALGSQHFASSSLSPPQLRSSPSTMRVHEFLMKGNASLSTDLDDDDDIL